MADPHNKEYYCCATNLTAAKIIALICITQRTLELCYFNDNLIHKALDLNLNDYIFGVFAIYIVVDILLLIGSLLRIRFFLLIWLFFAGISMVLAMTAMFSSYNGFGICIASLFWDAWTGGLVYGAYSDICKMKVPKDKNPGHFSA